MSLKAIETRYNGYRFRSRLEARWAVFFDTLGLEYRYEPEGYDLGEAGWYLPDFWLPGVGVQDTRNFGMWVEVKGSSITKGELSKCEALADQAPGVVAVLEGEVSSGESSDTLRGVIPGGFVDKPMLWMKCYTCGRVNMTFPRVAICSVSSAPMVLRQQKLECMVLRQQKLECMALVFTIDPHILRAITTTPQYIAQLRRQSAHVLSMAKGGDYPLRSRLVDPKLVDLPK